MTKTSDPEAVNAFFAQLGQFGCGSLILAHVVKNGRKEAEMPFGAVAWHNSSRQTFRADSEKWMDSKGLTITLTDMKHKRIPQRAYDLEWSTKFDVTVRPGDIQTVAAGCHPSTSSQANTTSP